MPTFIFQARGENGQSVKGEIDASTEMEARVRLRAQKLNPIKIENKATMKAQSMAFQFGNSEKVSNKDLSIFTRQFAVLVSAGVPIVQSLQAMSSGARSPALTNVLLFVVEEVERGRRLAEALALKPKVFDRMYVNLVRAGEESGSLDIILNRLADYLDTSVKLRNKVVSAMWYPAAIVVVAIVVVSAILIFVVPKLAGMYTSSGQELPWLTQKVIDVSNLVKNYWYLIFSVLGAIPVLTKMYYETDEGRKNLDSIMIDLPVIGTLIQKSGIARFSRTLSTTLSSGVRIIDALEIASATAGNYVLEKALGDTRDAVSRGKTLAEPINKIKYVPKMVAQMISIGEQTGNMDKMLGKIADFYEDEVENAAAAMTSLMEPILMVVLGTIVAIIVVAMYLPIFSMANVVGG